MATKKTYEPLSSMPHPLVTKCSEVLGNQMQCWRAGDFLITVTEDTPTDENPTATTTTSYQKCRRHAAKEQEADAGIAAETASDSANQIAQEVAKSAGVAEKNYLKK